MQGPNQEEEYKKSSVEKGMIKIFESTLLQVKESQTEKEILFQDQKRKFAVFEQQILE